VFAECNMDSELRMKCMLIMMRVLYADEELYTVHPQLLNS
jgi:hypothetical protein